MNLRECYIKLGGDYDKITARLFKEELIRKYLLMFLKDNSFSELCSSMADKDYETAFRSAHTLKGLCLNLELENLYKSVSDITEALRGNVNNGADELLPKVTEDYTAAIEAIKSLDD